MMSHLFTESETMSDQTLNAPIPASADDTRAAHAVPSTFVNRFHLTAGDVMMRITFGEQVIPDMQVSYHRAIVIPREEALMLAEMINQIFGAKQAASQH
jgi:hypothetical protein